MFITLVIVLIVICVFLGLIILVQNPKGGGLSSGFSGTNNIMGVQRTGDFLEKSTWGLTIAIMVICLLINITIPRGGVAGGDGSEDLQNQIDKPTQISPLSQPATQVPPADSAKK